MGRRVSVLSHATAHGFPEQSHAVQLHTLQIAMENTGRQLVVVLRPCRKEAACSMISSKC